MTIKFETQKIKTKEDFIQFLSVFYEDYKENGKNWENNTLDRFLETLIAYTEDVDGYYKNINSTDLIGKATWRVFADILIGTSMYE